MSQLQVQGQLIVKDLDRQIREAEAIGDSPTEIVLGWKARKAIIAFLGSIYGFTRYKPEDQCEFYTGIPVRASTKCMGEWTAHVSSLLPDGTVCRARVDG